ncbi:hypothetical protein LINGRAHAP2_LOCUS20453 [Linum grandiflorum]
MTFYLSRRNEAAVVHGRLDLHVSNGLSTT